MCAELGRCTSRASGKERSSSSSSIGASVQLCARSDFVGAWRTPEHQYQQVSVEMNEQECESCALHAGKFTTRSEILSGVLPPVLVSGSRKNRQ